jgi:uncharacterized protein YjiS (DUF1127 family)
MSEFILSAERTRRAGTMIHLLSTLWIWLERSRQRRQLANLDNRLLADIGLDSAHRDVEIGKPFWRA